MIEGRILTAVAARLDALLSPPRGAFVPWIVDGVAAGFLDDARARRVARFADAFVVDAGALAFSSALDDFASRSAALERVARALASEGLLSPWRDERYAVAPAFGDKPLFVLERAAARYFGILTYAAHVNGVTVVEGKERVWLARRSPGKAIDPGMLDNLVGGGIASGMGVAETVVKEAFEEAGISANLAATAVRVSEIGICRTQPDGLQRERVFVHDLALPADFVPHNQDGEVCEWRAVGVEDLARILACNRPPDVMTADASLVCVDWLLRRGHVPPRSRAAARLAALRLGRCAFAAAPA